MTRPPAPPQIPHRSCGTCTLCCRLPEIEVFSKPADAWCVNCAAGHGCRIYEDRPQLCRDFLCLWMTEKDLGPEWEPSVANMMVYRQGPQVTVLVDPAHSTIWNSEPYADQLRQWAKAEEARGGYVIVFAGDAVVKIDPAPVPA